MNAFLREKVANLDNAVKRTTQRVRNADVGVGM